MFSTSDGQKEDEERKRREVLCITVTFIIDFTSAPFQMANILLQV